MSGPGARPRVLSVVGLAYLATESFGSERGRFGLERARCCERRSLSCMRRELDHATPSRWNILGVS